MLSELVVTDITRMGYPFICIGAIDKQDRNIRPLYRNERFHQDWCCCDGTYIEPFTKIILDLEEHRPLPPHTEDWYVNPNVLRIREKLSYDEKFRLLNRIKDKNVKEIWGAELQKAEGQQANFIKNRTGLRSLGTIKVKKIIRFQHVLQNGRWDYRLTFTDESGALYRMKIVDLTFQTYIDYQRICQEQTPIQIMNDVMENVFNGCDTYLRIGLARGWGQYPDRCYLQITGVYSFPDRTSARSIHQYLQEIDRTLPDGPMP